LSSEWPSFEGVPLEGAKTWSASFDSYDQRTDDCYYLVTLFEEGRELARFMVVVFLAGVNGGADSSTALAERLREELARHARTMKSNTDYIGPVFR
jgi:hypothetical protein